MAEVLRKLGKITWFPKFVLLVLRRMPGLGVWSAISTAPVRSKALKWLALVVQEDPSVLSRDDMQRGVNCSFLDSATMVREVALDLVGKLIFHLSQGGVD